MFGAAESENIARLNQFDRGEFVMRSDIAFLGKFKIKFIKKYFVWIFVSVIKTNFQFKKNAESPFKNIFFLKIYPCAVV